MTPTSEAIRYVIGGVVIGGFWYLNHGRPPWEEALRTIVVFAIIMIIIKARLKRTSINVHLVPLIGSKAVLVVIAAIAQQEIRHSVSNPSLIVAIGLGAAVMILGRLGDGKFFSYEGHPSPARQVT